MWERLQARGTALLRFSERYTKTDMVYAAHGGFWLALSQAVQVASGLVLSVAFANFLPKESYGIYQFIMSGAVIISVFTLGGMKTAIIRAVARGSEGALRAGFRAQMNWSWGIALAGAAVASYYYLAGNQMLAFSFLIVGAFSPFLAGFGLTQSYFIGKQLFRDSLLLGLGRRLLPVVCLLTTVLLTHDPVALVFVYFASNTLSAGLLYLLVVERFRLPSSEENEMISYSKHLSAINILSNIVGQADKVLVFHFLGATSIAVYALALLPVKQIEALFTLLSSITFPKLSTMEFTTLKKVLPQKVRVLLVAAAVIVAAYILAAPFFFRLLFPTYPEAIVVSQVLALTLLSKPRSLYGQAFTAHQMKRELYIINISINILEVILLWVLLPLFGLWGAVYALLGSTIYSNVLVRVLWYLAR
jgi:O-antigen/teichoic acid export membrane protein